MIILTNTLTHTHQHTHYYRLLANTLTHSHTNARKNTHTIKTHTHAHTKLRDREHLNSTYSYIALTLRSHCSQSQITLTMRLLYAHIVRNRSFMTSLLFIMGTIVTITAYGGKPISCIGFTKTSDAFSEDYCWTQVGRYSSHH